MNNKQRNRIIGEAFDGLAQEQAAFNQKLLNLDSILTIFFFATLWQRVRWAVTGQVPGFTSNPTEREELLRAARKRAQHAFQIRREREIQKPVGAEVQRQTGEAVLRDQRVQGQAAQGQAKEAVRP